MNNKRNAIFVFGLLILSYTLVSGRLVWIQYIKNEYYVGIAQNQHLGRDLTFYPRGTIADCNNRTLAISNSYFDLYYAGTWDSWNRHKKKGKYVSKDNDTNNIIDTICDTLRIPTITTDPEPFNVILKDSARESEIKNIEKLNLNGVCIIKNDNNNPKSEREITYTVKYRGKVPAIPKDDSKWVEILRILDLSPSQLSEKIDKGDVWFPIKNNLSVADTIKVRDSIKSYYRNLNKNKFQGNDPEDQKIIEKLSETSTSITFGKFKFIEKQSRSYPNGSYASHIIGYTEKSVKDPQKYYLVGLTGVEEAMNPILQGHEGELRSELNSNKREVVEFRKYEKSGIEGARVQLTLDLKVQAIVEQEADRLMQTYTPATVCIIVMRPSTGEILALTNRPTFNPEDSAEIIKLELKSKKKSPNTWNRCFSDSFEPGSIFKIITLSAALDRGIATLDSVVDVSSSNPNLPSIIAGVRDDHKTTGPISVLRGMQISSNRMFALFGLKLGGDVLSEYVKNFGFGVITNPLLSRKPLEARGRIDAESWNKPVNLTRAAFGQGISVTPIQMISAFCVIANRGILMAPQIYKNFTKNERTSVFPPQMIRRVLPSKIAESVSHSLVSVVSDDGTGILAQVPGYVVAGKTGTAQKVRNGRYCPGLYVSSFVGYLPEDNPELAILVTVNEPHGSYYASQVAAPSFANIAKAAVEVLNILPTGSKPADPLIEARR